MNRRQTGCGGGGQRQPRPSPRARIRQQGDFSYPLPKSTAAALLACQGQEPQNPGLVFDRFAPSWGESSKWKKQGLQQVIEAAKRVDQGLLQAWNARWQAAAAARYAVPFSLCTDWRLIAGLGRKGPYEVGFTFHRYGFPYLPGSSVKGIARAAGLVELAGALGESDINRLAGLLRLDEPEHFRELFAERYPGVDSYVTQLGIEFRAIFGTTTAAGGAMFFDAIPARRPTLDLDIMNPHYPDYYQGSQWPTNWQSPVPVFFLTVAPDTEFRFAVGWRGSREREWESKWMGLRNRAERWLRQGLTELGAGGKTSAGYGYFRVTPDIETPAVAGPSAADAGKSAPVQTGTPTKAEPTEERRGTITEIRPDRRRGRLKDDETGREYTFSTSVIQGNFPARGGSVSFVLRGSEVIEVRRR
jgi:CRISPR-associated protein Cmr6